MAIDSEHLRKHYESLADEQLLGIERSELTALAQQCFDAELRRRNLSDVDEVDDDGDEEEWNEFEPLDPEHEPDWMPTAFPASTFHGSASGAIAAAEARDALLAAGIPCQVIAQNVEPEEEAPVTTIQREYRVMVPGAYILQATSALDVAIFNGHLEDEWKTQLASLSDQELQELNVESLVAALLDRVERLRKVYREERAKRVTA